MGEQILLDKARHVVEDLLDVGGFIDGHQQEIYEMLERTERRALDLAARAEVRKASVDEIFVVESLPLITGVIHGGSRRQNFERAKQHLVLIMPGSEAASGLSLLTLLYIVEKAWRRFQHSPSAHQKALWGDIRARVWRLL